jgi:hypothetical protein
LPKRRLIVNEYANEKTKFQIINNSNSTLDQLIDTNLIVNTMLNQQPIELIKNLSTLLSSPNGAFNGLGFSSLSATNVLDNLVLFYNDSATLGLSNLLQIVSNLYSRLEGSQQINVSIGAMPKLPDQCASFTFDTGIFSALMVLGLAFVVPVISFTVELVHDKEVFVFVFFFLLFLF